MNKSRKSRGVCASLEGKKLLEEAKDNKRLTYDSIAELAQVSDKTVRRLFDGEKIDRSNAKLIITELGLEYDSVISREEDTEDKVRETIETVEGQNDSDSANELVKDLKKILEEYKKNRETENQAMNWLELNRYDLAKQAASVALKECGNQILYDGDIEYVRILEELSNDVREYLRFCYISLKEGTIEVLEEARRQSLMPNNFDSELYKKALLFIKEQKVTYESLGACLQYLIAIV
jgi:hypothetical protein